MPALQGNTKQRRLLTPFLKSPWIDCIPETLICSQTPERFDEDVLHVNTISPYKEVLLTGSFDEEAALSSLWLSEGSQSSVALPLVKISVSSIPFISETWYKIFSQGR
jgi:hypothetical protein